MDNSLIKWQSVLKSDRCDLNSSIISCSENPEADLPAGHIDTIFIESSVPAMADKMTVRFKLKQSLYGKFHLHLNARKAVFY